MHPFLMALAGGSLIGLAATLLLGINGQVAGISGIVGRLVPPAPESSWRVAFVAGLVLAGFAWVPLLPDAFAAGDRSVFAVMLAGLLVGFGTRLGNGCTSGHGVCGMARFSKRSFSAVGVFLATGVLTATLFGLLTRGVT
ncbi:MAG: YeeE/YedE family protein [Deltaproteobacteria bacterium]|nr:YeeE/YedE family protein [Deltaproteobacteria bacterium]HCH66541.1 YeeE/YedE family protein [Deltaproteobacteria bacterium]